MEGFRNKHEGERVFIFGTGPSLNQVPFDKLNDEYTIALGGIHLLYDEIDWRPTYFVNWDIAMEEYRPSYDLGESCPPIEAHLDCDTTLFLSNAAKKYYPEKPNTYYYNWQKPSAETLQNADETKDVGEIFSDDFSKEVYNFGGTITVAVQLAHFLGFEEIYFVGCDLYEEQRPYMVFEDANDPNYYADSSSTFVNFINLVSDGDTPIRSAINGIALKLYRNMPSGFLDDPNHFSSSYNPAGAVEARAKNKSARKMHRRIEWAGEQYGFDVYNATIGGYLEVHERVDLFELLE